MLRAAPGLCLLLVQIVKISPMPSAPLSEAPTRVALDFT
jgi:hypothetical protein